MAEIRIQITDKQLLQLQKEMENGRHKSINKLINSKIKSFLRQPCEASEGVQIKKISKHFRISEVAFSKLQCFANNKGITVNALVMKEIVQPMLEP